MKTESNIRKMVILLSTVFSLSLTAQEAPKPSINSYDYKNAIGIRVGETSGFTYKHMFSKGNAFEGIVSAYPYVLGFTALYEKHLQTGAPGLMWYFGAGGHGNIGGPSTRVYYGYNGDRRYTYIYRTGAFAAGVDGIIGVEYKIKPIPLSLSADLKPFTEFNDYGNIYMSIDPSIGVKFTF